MPLYYPAKAYFYNMLQQTPCNSLHCTLVFQCVVLLVHFVFLQEDQGRIFHCSVCQYPFLKYDCVHFDISMNLSQYLQLGTSEHVLHWLL